MVAPGRLNAIISLLANEPGVWLPIAGGTDVMVQYAAGKLAARKLVSIWNLPELRQIEATANEIRLGAGCTYSDLRSNEIVRREFPLLYSASVGPAELRTRIEGRLAETSLTHRRPPTPCPRCWFTMPN